MKKFFKNLVVAALAVVLFSSCGLGSNPFKTNYFDISGATFVNAPIPSPSGELPTPQISINRSAIAGGSSIVNISSVSSISTIYIGIKGESYHYELSTTGISVGTNIYSFVLLISQHLHQNFTIIIVVKDSAGNISYEWTAAVKYIEAGTGALQISLSFNKEKDLDLYVVRPDGSIIYYRNKGGSIEGQSQTWGLDVDSNAGCSIDGINNENVFFPKDYLLNGKYEVWVNQYKNCDTSVPINWVVTAIHNESYIKPTVGVNPAYGEFAATRANNQISSDLNDKCVKVMEFNITGGVNSIASSISENETMIAPSQSAVNKYLHSKGDK